MKPSTLVLSSSLALAAAACFTAAGGVIGTTRPDWKPTTPQALDAVKPDGEPVVVRLVALWPPAGTLPGAFELKGHVVRRDAGALFVRNEAGTWKVNHPTIASIEVRSSSGWTSADPERAEEDVEVRMRLLKPRPPAQRRSEYRLEGVVAKRRPGELVVRNDRGTWRVYDEDLKSIEIMADTQWKEGLAQGAVYDLQVIGSILLVAPR